MDGARERWLVRVGAVPLGQGSWAVPDVAVFTDGVAKAVELAERGDGEVVMLCAVGRHERGAARMRELLTADRAAEWTEFLADCATFDAEIDEELRIEKLTLAELEEERSLERLRRRYRAIRTRDVFGTPGAAEAEQPLKHCTERLEHHTEQVFTALQQM